MTLLLKGNRRHINERRLLYSTAQRQQALLASTFLGMGFSGFITMFFGI